MRDLLKMSKTVSWGIYVPTYFYSTCTFVLSWSAIYFGHIEPKKAWEQDWKLSQIYTFNSIPVAKYISIIIKQLEVKSFIKIFSFEYSLRNAQYIWLIFPVTTLSSHDDTFKKKFICKFDFHIWRRRGSLRILMCTLRCTLFNMLVAPYAQLLMLWIFHANWIGKMVFLIK